MKFYLTGQKLERIDEVETIANNSIDYTEAEFIIDNPRFKEKEINAINAIFQNEDTQVSYTVKLDDTYKIEVPYEAIKDTEQVNISLVALADNKAYTTSQVKVKLKNSGYDDTKTPEGPTPTVYQQLLSDMNKKQNKLTAGNNITISEDNVISATGGSTSGHEYSIIKDEEPETPNSLAEYHLVEIVDGNPIEVGTSIPIPNQSLEPGKNVSISKGVISADVGIQDITGLNEKITGLNTNKQNKLTAGENITISEDNVISATGGGGSSSYLSGDYIDIKGNTISAKIQKGTENTVDNLATIQNLYDLEKANEGINSLSSFVTNQEYCFFTNGLIMFTITGTINANNYLAGDNDNYAQFHLPYSNYSEPKSLVFNSGEYDIDLIFNDNGEETVYNKRATISVFDNTSIEFKIKVKSDINVTAFSDTFRIAIVATTIVPAVIDTKVDLNNYQSIDDISGTANAASINANKYAYQKSLTTVNNLTTEHRTYSKYYGNMNDEGYPLMIDDAPDEMKQITQDNLFGVFISKDKVDTNYIAETHSTGTITIYRLQVHYLEANNYKVAEYIKYKYTSDSTTYETEWKQITTN